MKSYFFILTALCALLSCKTAPETIVPAPSPVDSYSIHEDGGLIYNPLFNLASTTGQLARYAKVQKEQKSIIMDNYTLTYEVPEKSIGYDVVPIPYKIKWTGKPAFPLAIEATAFEEQSRRNGKDLFDLALPGNLDLEVEYLGSVTAHMKPGARQNLKPDLTDEPGEYPAFERSPMVRSGIVESGDIIWFRFRVKNTGNTILDPEGFGGWGIDPQLMKKDEKNVYRSYSMHYNWHIRDRKYLYPGESHDFWINFTSSKRKESYRIEPGEYKINFFTYYRYYKEWNDVLNYWSGASMYNLEMPVIISEKPKDAPVPPLKVLIKNGGQEDKITRYIHTLEEFMTSFDCWQKSPVNSDSITGTLYLQVAPWTKDIVVKLISTKPVQCRTMSSSIIIDNTELTLKPKLHPGNCLVENGKRVPVVYSQLMSDMRANIQVSPWPEKYIREDIHRMVECGVNVCATTAMPWLYDDFRNPAENHNGDAMKYSLDVARKEGMKLEAWGSYPFDRSTIASLYKDITNDTIHFDIFGGIVSFADPNIAKANAAIWMYQLKRWGDAYAIFESGKIPFATEDTRGWMRQDIHVRLPIGKLSKMAFREWLKNKYTSVEKLNTQWNTRYSSFEEVDPEANAAVNIHGHRWEYSNQGNTFHDWNKPIADFDEWRTSLRIKNYKESLEILQKEVPQAALLVRTEGANAIVDGLNPADPNPHYRHIYYSQRRVAAIGEQMVKSKVLSYHSDYTTLPYTPVELRRITGMGVSQGIIPAWLPQFDNMRDIALNQKYGTDYQVNFNSDKPVKGAMMHVLCPIYPWYQAVIEEGGIPGLLWEDLECDGFVTETQERELIFYRGKMEEYLSSPEGIKASVKNVKSPDNSWLKKTKPKISYHVN